MDRSLRKMASTMLRSVQFALVSMLTTTAQRSPFSRFNFPNQAGLDIFSQQKFGLFVHWGPISQWGAEISFPLVCTSFPCDSQGPNGSSVTIHNVTELEAHRQAYRNLASTFNPTAFNPDALADLAQAAGFRYLTWVGTHCDGFSQWASPSNANYSIMATPYGKDVMGPIVNSFRARGMRAGVYVCPSFWNRDDYFFPNALTSFGTCCQPNYVPSTNTAAWTSFTSYLHEQLAELATLYQPDHYWLDSGTYPPNVDTHIEQVVPQIRAANPTAVVHVRDGGIYHDYAESVDHSEDDAHDILGMSYIRPGDYWEVPGTLGEQWAYDPHATYLDAPSVVRKLIAVLAKGGNYLLNIGLDPTGVWAPDAVDTLTNMSLWMSYNAESIHNTSVMFPYEYFHGPLEGDDGLLFTQYFTQSLIRNSSYVYLVDDRGASITSSSDVIIPMLKPSVLASLPVNISILTAGGDVTLLPSQYTIDEMGLSIPASLILQPAPVLLRTYFCNFSNPTDVSCAGQRFKRKVADGWPRAWWKKNSTAATASGSAASAAGAVSATGRVSSATKQFGAGKRRGATGSNSIDRLAAQLQASADAYDHADDESVSAVYEDNAPVGTRPSSVYTAAGYKLVRPEGVCYASSLLPGGEAAVQLNLFYNGQYDNMAAPSPPVDGQSWQLVDSECWVYATAGSQPGARYPVEVWHSAVVNDYWTLADPASRSTAQSLGYTLVQSIGFVDQTPAGGQLTPAQQEAAAAAYAYVLRLDW